MEEQRRISLGQLESEAQRIAHLFSAEHRAEIAGEILEGGSRFAKSRQLKQLPVAFLEAMAAKVAEHLENEAREDARINARSGEVVAQIGHRYAKVFELQSKGKTHAQIASTLGYSKGTINQMLVAINYHLDHFRRTGKLPEDKEPLEKHWRQANKFVRKNFAKVGARRSVMHRAVALGLAGRLPLHKAGIYDLVKAVRKESNAFPPQLRYLRNGRK